MRDAQRRAILRRYVESLHGGRTAFMRMTKLSKGRVTQLLYNSNEPFGERAGSNIARKCGLPADFFERRINDAPSTISEEMRKSLLMAWEKLTPSQRVEKLHNIQAMAARNIEIAKQMGHVAIATAATPPDPKRHRKE